jgi:hypothetical protein
MHNDMRDRLVELIKEGANGHTLMPTDSIADYLIANGVVLPPCRVGQTVYMVTLDGKIRDITVTDVSIKVSHWETWYDILGAYMVDNIKHIIAVLPCKIGEIIFYTKYQAEQKLKELSDNG